MRRSVRTMSVLYEGQRFRSRSEARWAVFLDEIGLTWQYEPEGFQLEARSYLPDFWVPSLGLSGAFLEVKGSPPSDLELQLCRELAMHTRKPVFLHFGVIGPRFGPTQGLRGFIPPMPTTSRVLLEESELYWCECPKCKRIGITRHGQGQLVCAGRCCPVSEKLVTADSPRFTRAFMAARTHSFWDPPRRKEA